MVYRCPHCRCEVEKSAAACGACGRSVVPVSWGRLALGLPAWAPDAFVDEYARVGFAIRTGLLLIVWAGIVAAGAYTVTRMGSELVDQAADAARVAAALEAQEAPEHLRSGTLDLMSANRALLKPLRAGGWVILAAGVMGLVGEGSAFWMVRRLLGARREGLSKEWGG